MDKFGLLVLETANFRVLNVSVFSCCANDSVVAVMDGYSNEALFTKRRNIATNLAITDAEEFGEISVGSIAPSFIVEAANLHEKNFLHKRQLIGEPYLFWNPDAFKIPIMLFHYFILSHIDSFTKWVWWG